MDRFPVRLILLCFISFCASSYATKRQDVDIYSFHINSTVTSRYAITVITSRVANRLNSSKEIHFQVKIPKNAFISKFKLTTEGKTYDGVVKQKEEAQQQYSQASFTQYYNGSEIVVAGQITDNSLETFQTEVIAISKHNNVTYQDSVSIIDFTDVLPEDENFIQRLWAYLTVKQLLTLSDHEKEMVRKKALYLSLKYKFVTPLTSMVVTKPQEEQTQVAHKPSEEESKCQFSLSPPAGGVRFIISAQPKPICYDMPADHKLRLLQDSSSNFSMNGELSSNGFNLIFLHYKTDHLMLSTKEIHYYDGQKHQIFTWGQPKKHETDSLSLNLLQNNQMDVTMGTVCVGVLRHEKDGDTFLWPVVKQPPSNMHTKILHLHYTEQGSKIKLKDQETKATWSTATDYQNSSTPTVQCWLVPFQFALQGELSDFKVLQL
uniref:VIT domain-containing protein n=1 Tax=Electrophorus electricus TaxID=8005 RepID=A0AAY5ECA7_ELEEL